MSTIKTMETIYELRKVGLTETWGAFTRCIKCNRAFLWGVKDNLLFVCGDCEHPLSTE